MGAVSAFTPLLAVLVRVNWIEEVPLAVMVPLDMVTPPALWPDPLTWNLEGTCLERSSGSLNVIVSTPVEFWYAADDTAGLARSAVNCSTADAGLWP